MNDPLSLHMVASKALGGAERWFTRFATAMAERGVPAELAIRAGSALESLDPGPLRLHRLPFHTTWDPLSRAAVARLIAQRRPDIVQTYMGRATRLTHLPRPARGGGGGPIHIARLGGYYRLGPYRHAHAWIGNTRGLCDWMIREGLPASRVHQIYNFADPPSSVAADSVAAHRVALGLPEDAWVLVSLGRLVPVKGHCHLIAALADLPGRISDRAPHLVIVGDGPLAAPLRRQAEQTGQAGRIHWAGWQDDPAPYLQMADLVVFPSLDAETLGNVILEAWAWGKPLVTAQFRGAREIARHGEDAWCVPCADPSALAAGIATLLADESLRRELVEQGRTRVERDFGREAVLDQYLALYRDLAGG